MSDTRQPASPAPAPRREAAPPGTDVRRAASAAEATLYYDGSCPVCAREIRWYRSRADSVEWVDVSACGEADVAPDLDREQALSRLHLRRGDGTLVSGADAMVEVWRRIPALAPLARVAGTRPGRWLLEGVYRVFLALRERLPHAFRSHSGALPPDVTADLRTDHAGETGAVMLYRGVLAVARDPALRAFAREHMATEQQHLDLVCGLVNERERSALLPLWRVAGWLTGALPALLGPRAVYVTVDAVESFVDGHYAEQVVRMQADTRLAPVAALLQACRADELHHRDEARRRLGGPARGLLARTWTALVDRGSRVAVSIARQI